MTGYMCVCLSAEVFIKGVWTVLDSLEDPELWRLAHSLPQTVLSSRADSTTTKYMYSFRRWKLWAETKKEVKVFPVQDVQFALYLQHLAEITSSKASVEEAVITISWAHQLAGMPPISAATFVRAVLTGFTEAVSEAKIEKRASHH